MNVAKKCGTFIVLVLCLHSTVIAMQSLSADESKGTEPRIVNLDWLYIDDRPGFNSYSLGVARPGEKIQARMLLKNHSTKAVGLNSAKVSCACTTTKIPKVVVAAGDSLPLEFEFAVDTRIGREKHSFDVHISTDDGNVHPFIFKVDISEASCFLSKNAYIVLPENGAVKFELPVFKSSDVPISSIKVEVTDNFEGAAFRSEFAIRGDQVIAKCEFRDEFGVFPDSVTGEIRIVSVDGKIRDNISLIVTRRGKLEVLPNRMVFVPDIETPGEYRARAVVKVVADPNKAIPQVTCCFQDGLAVSTQIKEIGKGIFFMSIRLNRQEVETRYGGKSVLVWRIALTDVREVSTPIDFAN